MTIEIKYCPECGSDIKFSYITPDRSYRIDEDGKIRRDDAWKGPEYDNPSFIFYCSNDRGHVLRDDNEFYKWMEDVENATFTQNLFA